MGEHAQKPGGAVVPLVGAETSGMPAPGKRTLTEQLNGNTASPGVAGAAHSGGQSKATHAVTGSAGGSPTTSEAQIAPPAAGIDKTGFIDNSNGARVYNKPAEANGEPVCAPLTPAARVYVSGTHPRLKHWWYVTAYGEQGMVRGYVEDFRINTQLPEPLAELRQLVGGETAEALAREKFGHAVADGRDLRYYENVLLYVNQGRAGVKGQYQRPGPLGGGSNNVQLVAGHRIWLVSAEYAKALESVVPSGSLTGGKVAKVKRFVGHLEDILQSVTEARNHFDDVAGEFAQAIRDHLAEIIGITAGFLMAEATSMFLAAAPTGVSQAAAVVIQLALAAFGAAGMIEAGAEALKHGSAWLNIAWTAHGKAETIAEASKEFVRMLVAIAIAALSYSGAKANYRHALKIAKSMPTSGLPLPATGVSRARGGTQAAAGVAIGAGPGGLGAAGTAALRLSDGEKAGLGEGPDVDGLRDRDVGEAQSSERHDRRAAEGRRPSSSKAEAEPKPTRDAQPGRTRTELAEHVPPPGESFMDWFDALTSQELERLLADEGTKSTIGAAEVIADHIRHPGSKHEWLMVGEARRFKQWGVSMRTILEGRTTTLATIGKRFRHGGAGAGAMHNQLRAMIRSSSSFHEFLQKLNAWADRELVASHSNRWPQDAALGRYSLPDNLQIQGHR